MKGLIDMTEEKKNKYSAQMKYNQTKRENLNIGLAKGTKEIWNQQAINKGFKSLTSYITWLIENDK